MLPHRISEEKTRSRRKRDHGIEISIKGALVRAVSDVFARHIEKIDDAGVRVRPTATISPERGLCATELSAVHHRAGPVIEHLFAVGVEPPQERSVQLPIPRVLPLTRIDRPLGLSRHDEGAFRSSGQGVRVEAETFLGNSIRPLDSPRSKTRPAAILRRRH